MTTLGQPITYYPLTRTARYYQPTEAATAGAAILSNTKKKMTPTTYKHARQGVPTFFPLFPLQKTPEPNNVHRREIS